MLLLYSFHHSASMKTIMPFANASSAPDLEIIDKLKADTQDGEPNFEMPTWYFFHGPPADRSFIALEACHALGIKPRDTKALLRRHIVIASLIPTTSLIKRANLAIEEPENGGMEDDFDEDADPADYGIKLKPNWIKSTTGLSTLDLMNAGANCWLPSKLSYSR